MMYKLSEEKLYKLASEAVEQYQEYNSSIDPNAPKTYAGAAFKAGAGLGAAVSVGKRLFTNRTSHLPIHKGVLGAALAGGALWGAASGLAGGVVKRNNNI